MSNFFLKAWRPNVGKLLNPQPSEPAKNHWKQAQEKLPTKDLKSTQTCFLYPNNDTIINHARKLAIYTYIYIHT